MYWPSCAITWFLLPLTSPHCFLLQKINTALRVVCGTSAWHLRKKKNWPWAAKAWNKTGYHSTKNSFNRPVSFSFLCSPLKWQTLEVFVVVVVSCDCLTKRLSHLENICAREETNLSHILLRHAIERVCIASKKKKKTTKCQHGTSVHFLFVRLNSRPINEEKKTPKKKIALFIMKHRNVHTSILP